MYAPSHTHSGKESPDNCAAAATPAEFASMHVLDLLQQVLKQAQKCQEDGSTMFNELERVPAS